MTEIGLEVSSMKELRRKVEAFKELFGEPKKIWISPPIGKSYISLRGGDDIWGRVEVLGIFTKNIVIEIDEGQSEQVALDWERNAGLQLVMKV